MSEHILNANNPSEVEDAPVERSDCRIVGGGPAGAVLALLLARHGAGVTLLEAHGDFNRDFRGDSLQPAVLQLLAQMVWPTVSSRSHWHASPSLVAN
jgi:2-polyprenyl-6-methoxyphenol hydroxylase-like FAD-dependent oxidoreductase